MDIKLLLPSTDLEKIVTGLPKKFFHTSWILCLPFPIHVLFQRPLCCPGSRSGELRILQLPEDDGSHHLYDLISYYPPLCSLDFSHIGLPAICSFNTPGTALSIPSETGFSQTPLANSLFFSKSLHKCYFLNEASPNSTFKITTFNPITWHS